MYNVDYALAVTDLLSPDKRTPRDVAFMTGLSQPISQLDTDLFSTYKDAQFGAPLWDGSPVDRNGEVRYGKSIFRSEVDANTGEPTFTDDWVLVSENYLGTDFRLAIRGEKLILEYALNVWFETAFRQPPLVSDIFITTNTVLAVPVFRVGQSENRSSSVGTLGSSEYVGNVYSFATQYNGAINIPIAVYNALGATDDVREAIVRSFADKYIDAGIVYRIITY